MKDKILMLIIGVLLGAIITAGCFMLFGNNRRPNMPENGEFRGGRMENMVAPEKPGTSQTTSTDVQEEI